MIVSGWNLVKDFLIRRAFYGRRIIRKREKNQEPFNPPTSFFTHRKV
jgi:hypothetical protein